MPEPSPDTVADHAATMIDRIRNMLALVIPDPRGIDIKIQGGVVTLSGQLRDSAQRRAATLITHRVDGVTNVVNKLTLWHETTLYGALLPRPAARRARPAIARKGPGPMAAPASGAA
jgi:hypothetical protein